jgi:isoquinoline 1-oxidoreductase beta subunit
MRKWTRRAFITAGSLAGGGLVLGVAGVAFAPNRLGVTGQTGGDATPLTTWLKITPDNEIIAVIPHCEMGQGAQTGLAMMLAEELDADWSHVRIEEAPAEDIYANGHMISGFLQQFQQVPAWLTRPLEYTAYRISRIIPMQVTGGSASTITTGQYGMKVAGAAARVMLLESAARKWDVPADECTASRSWISHESSGRRESYGQLAHLAAELTPPVHPPFKSRDQYTLVGTSQPRRDLPDKVTGKAQYGVDVSLPDMLYATVAASPIPGGKLQSVDPAPAQALNGVHQVVELEDAVAVVASGYWPALQGMKALTPEFTDAGLGDVSTQSFYARHAAVLDADDGSVDFQLGDGAEALENADTVVEFEYRLPYLAHATMEPMAATARVAEGRCEVWAGTQDPLNARKVAADAAGLDEDDVIFHNMPLGGGFGRRLPFAFDYVDQAVRVAKAMSPAPVKLIWSREEDMKHDFYRPAMLARFRGGLDDRGNPTCWYCSYTGPGEFGAARPVYSVPNQEIVINEPPVHLRTGSWRSVGFSQQGFLMETFIDELAHTAGEDPLTFRRKLLGDKPNHLAVLDRAARMSDWNGPLPAGHGRGIALVESFGTICAEVAEASMDSSGTIRVHKVWAAVDCGLVVNPDQALAQIQGGIIFGLSAALFQEITLRNGAVEQKWIPARPWAASVNPACRQLRPLSPMRYLQRQVIACVHCL